MHPIASSRFPLGLSGKVLLLVVATSTVGALIATALMLLFQWQQCEHNTTKLNQRIATVVATNVHAAGVDGAEIVPAGLIDSLAHGLMIDGIFVTDRNGLDLSVTGSMAGEYGGIDAEIAARAAQGMPVSTSVAHTGHRDLVTVNALLNDASCSGCHDPAVETLGFVIVRTPMKSFGALLENSLLRALLMSSVIFALLAVSLIAVLRRLILRPLADLNRGAVGVSTGNLDVPVPVSGSDELGALARAFEQMRRSIKSSLDVLEQQNNELALLNDVGAQVGASLESSQILETVAEGAQRLLKAENGFVALWHDDRQAARVEVATGFGATDLENQILELRSTPQFLPLEPAWVTMTELAPDAQATLAAAGLAALFAVPLRRQSRFLGFLGVMTRTPRETAPEEAALLINLAHQTVTALENAQLYRDARHLAVLEEQQRLSQELHDRLAQSVGYLNLRVAFIADSLSCDQLEMVRAGLLEIKEIVADTYVDVRESIFNLRNTGSASAESCDLLATLRNYLDEYRRHYALATELESPDLAALGVAPEVSTQLLRIVQEALSNVRKHAEATRATVAVACADDACRVTIRDNGRGRREDSGTEPRTHHYGLRIMEERARSIGGWVEIDSTPDQGFCVIVTFPVGVGGPENAERTPACSTGG